MDKKDVSVCEATITCSFRGTNVTITLKAESMQKLLREIENAIRELKGRNHA